MSSQFISRAACAAVLALGGALHLGCVLPDYVEAKGSCEPGTPWTRKLGGDLFDVVFTAAADPCGGVTVGGGFQSFVDFGVGPPVQATKMGFDSYVVRFDAVGDVVWAATAGAEGNQFVTHLRTDIFGNAVAAGIFSGTLVAGGEAIVSEGPADGVEYSAFLTKLDLFGAHQWTRVYRGNTDLVSTGPCGVVVDRDGNVTIVGEFLGQLEIEGTLYQTEPLAGAIFVAHYDANGKLLWTKSFMDDMTVECSAIAADNDGNIVMTGAYSSDIDFGRGALTPPGAGTRFFVLKMKPDGTVDWSRGTNGGDDQFGTAITTDAAGNVFVGGSFYGLLNLGNVEDVNAVDGTDIFVQKLNPAGAPQWGTSYVGKDNDEILAIAVDSAGDLLISGATLDEITFEQTHPAPQLADPATKTKDPFLARLRGSDGAPIASRTFKGTGDDVLNSIALDQSNFPIVAGNFGAKIDLGPGPGEIVADDIGLGTIYIAKMAPLAPP